MAEIQLQVVKGFEQDNTKLQEIWFIFSLVSSEIKFIADGKECRY